MYCINAVIKESKNQKEKFFSLKCKQKSQKNIQKQDEKNKSFFTSSTSMFINNLGFTGVV
jgi:hypothetical protein